MAQGRRHVHRTDHHERERDDEHGTAVPAGFHRTPAAHFSLTVCTHEIAWFGDTVRVIFDQGEPDIGVTVNG